MARRKSVQRRKINPIFFIFCEGETEKEYINYLRSRYKIPIEIKSKISGNKISQKHIRNFLKGKPTSPKDKIFLMYDLDVPEILDKLKSIKKANLLVSNPCIELWFLIHHQNQNANINSGNCIRKLENFWKVYKKGELTESLKKKLTKNEPKAINRAKKMKLYDNPSTNVFEIIEELDNVINQKVKNIASQIQAGCK